MTTLARTLSDLLWRTRWGLVVLASAWLLLASGLASASHFERGSLPLALGLSIYAATLARAVLRELSPRTAARTPKAELELGLLLITGVFLLVALTGGLSSPAHPLVYALVSFLLIIHRTRWVAFAWLGSIAALELIVGASAGAKVVYHLGYIGFFAAGNLLVLGGLVRRLRQEHSHRVEGELQRMRQEARDFRLIDARARARDHAATKKIDPAVLLGARLFPDMLPMIKQVQIATDHAKGAVARLAGAEPPRYEDTEQSFDELRARIAKTIAFVESLSPEKIDGSEQRPIALRVGGRDWSFTGQDYLLGFALPNFHFHLVTAYNILRHNGIEIGKGDYLGNP